MKSIYFECNSGISGDMAVGTLLDLGGDIKYLEDALNSLNIDGYAIQVHEVSKCGIGATKFDVILKHEHSHEHHNHEHTHENHSHNHHSHEHTHKNHSHDHHSHEYTHENHSHGHHSHEHEHRGLREIVTIIDESALTVRAKSLAEKMFEVVADAESKCHRVSIEDVHFHEVGAIDSIIDIVSVAVLIDYLDIEHIITGQINEGTGTVICQHGVIPVPSPATSQIFSSHNIPFNITSIKGEMVTPTGAAIVACLTDEFGTPPDNVVIDKIGIGAGTKDFDHANILRAFMFDYVEDSEEISDSIIKIETNIDDTTGEHMGYVMDILLKLGANDVYFTPITMKKNRPAVMLTVLTNEDKFDQMVNTIFKHSSTIGVRYQKMNRVKMLREFDQIDSKYGVIDIKKMKYGDIQKITIEHESAKEAANRNNVSVKDIEIEILKNV